ncbi:hypothetical protein [Paraburkholderia tropica]|uniref:hypothetical protein n=1 Tax=Paraburkholderia tropica TaxID=92647 RepID=UPI002AB7BF7E|nr:hypothetical protein [Paraburkholderia tropica]
MYGLKLVALIVLFFLAAIVLLINLTSMRGQGIEPWDQEGENPVRSSRLDFLRTMPVFYAACAVILACGLTFILSR